MSNDDARDRFFETVRGALGKSAGSNPDQVAEAGPDADEVLEQAQARADDLLAELEQSAVKIGWKVARVKSTEEASGYVASLACDLEAGSALRSAHAVVDSLDLESRLAGTGIEVRLMAVDDDGTELPDQQRRRLRDIATAADLGVTGVDYAIAETGSCVLIARKGVSRLVSLLPPVHVALVERGQVLPGLDELFVLRKHNYSTEAGEGYMNMISGPSRSADIEQTLVTGVHGPRETHMLLLD